jgi:hypothetical protein
LATRFPAKLARVLLAIGMSEAFVERELAEMDRWVVAKTASSSLLGMLN